MLSIFFISSALRLWFIRQYKMHLVFNNTTRLAKSFLNWRFRSSVTATLSMAKACELAILSSCLGPNVLR